MTANEFNAECATRNIDTALALENEEICRALRDRNDEKVREILNTEF